LGRNFIWAYMHDSLIKCRIDIKFNMVSKQGAWSWLATIPVWLKIVCTYRALLTAYTWGGMLVCPILKKFKDLSVYISLWVTPPIANWFFWEGISFRLICMTPLFNDQLIYENLTGFARECFCWAQKNRMSRDNTKILAYCFQRLPRYTGFTQ